jgi:hypothetical protein
MTNLEKKMLTPPLGGGWVGLLLFGEKEGLNA